MKKQLRFCPNCGKKVNRKKYKELWGSARNTMSHGSAMFLECPYCKFQFNLRRPTEPNGKIEVLKPHRIK